MKPLLATLCLLLAASTAAAAPLSASKTATMQRALDDLTLALADHGYQLVKVQPLDQALVKRGFADPGVRLAFVGREDLVRQALAADPALLNLLPLRLTLEQAGGTVSIRSDDLASWRAALPDAGPVLQAWEDELGAILADYQAVR
jgi:uncharacterized protein (DUF302 family)